MTLTFQKFHSTCRVENGMQRLTVQYSSHYSGAATEHMKSGWFKLTCVITIKYPWDFEHLVWKKACRLIFFILNTSPILGVFGFNIILILISPASFNSFNGTHGNFKITYVACIIIPVSWIRGPETKGKSNEETLEMPRRNHERWGIPGCKWQNPNSD